MKKLFTLMLVVLIAFMTACSPEAPEKASLRVDIDEVPTGRTIRPADEPVIESYRLVAVNEKANEKVDVNFTEKTHTQDGMTPGSWKIRVEGLDSGKKVVAESAEHTVALKAGQDNRLTVRLDWTKTGTGTFRVTVTSKAYENLGGFRVKITARTEGAEPETVEVTEKTEVDGNVTFTKDIARTPGQYDIEMTALDSALSLVGNTYIESLHIFSGKVAEISLPWGGGSFMKLSSPRFSHDGKNPVEEGTKLSLIAEEGAVIKYSLDGGPETLYENPIVLTRNCTVSAYAEKEGFLSSEEDTLQMKVMAIPPEFSLPSGTAKDAPFTLYLVPNNQYDQLYWTFEDIDQTDKLGTPYDPQKGIEIVKTCTVRAAARREGLELGYDSVATYTITPIDGGVMVVDPENHALTVTYGDGTQITGAVDCSSVKTVKAAVAPAPSGVTWKWYVDGTEVKGAAKDTVTVGTADADIMVPAGDSIVAVKALFGNQTLTENIQVKAPSNRLAFFPDFSGNDAGPKTRGLTNITKQDAFGGDMVLGSNIMISMPAMASLRSLILKPSAQLPEISDTFTTYGVEVRPEIAVKVGNEYRTACRINEDGVFMRYDVMEGETVVGIIDYYYSWKDKTFSYRQYLMNTMIFHQMNDMTSDNFFCYELLDIPVNERDMSFSAGQLLPDGTLAQDAMLDCVMYDESSVPFYNKLYSASFNRSYATLSSVNGETAAYTRENDSIIYNPGQPDQAPEVMNMLAKYIGEGNRIGDGNRDKLALPFVYDMLELIYDRGSHIRSTSIYGENAGTYRTYEEFKADSLKKNNVSELWKGCQTWNNAPSTPTIYNARDNKGAATHIVTYKYYCEEIIRNRENFEKSGFSHFYTIPETVQSEEDWVRAFTKAHLNRCGITDEKFIESYVEEVLQRPLNKH